jgi:hypothetical protein
VSAAIDGLLAIRRTNGAPLAICEVTVQGWQHRETVDGETFRARYFTERERDLLAALERIVECDLSAVRSDYNGKLLDAIADAHDLLAKVQS